MAVMDHHGPLLPMYFAKQILTTAYRKHLQIILSLHKSKITTAATSRSTISYFPIRDNKST